jgi:hypothetical protein
MSNKNITSNQKKMILDHTSVNSIQNVDGRRTNVNTYAYLARGNQLIKNRTFATQSINYTNPNISNNSRTSNVIRIPYTINCNLLLYNNFGGTYLDSNKDKYIVKEYGICCGRIRNATIEVITTDSSRKGGYGKISYATINNNIMSWSWSGNNPPSGWAMGPFFAKLIKIGDKVGLAYSPMYNTIIQERLSVQPSLC